MVLGPGAPTWNFSYFTNPKHRYFRLSGLLQMLDEILRIGVCQKQNSHQLTGMIIYLHYTKIVISQ